MPVETYANQYGLVYATAFRLRSPTPRRGLLDSAQVVLFENTIIAYTLNPFSSGTNPKPAARITRSASSLEANRATQPVLGTPQTFPSRTWNVGPPSGRA